MNHTNMQREDNVEEFSKNIALMNAYWQELSMEFIKPRSDKRTVSQSGAMEAFADVLTEMMLNPEKVIDASFDLYKEYSNLMNDFSLRMAGGDKREIYKPDKKDRRFNDETWTSHIVFDFVKQSYFMMGKWMKNTVNEIDGIDDKTARKVDFYTRQFIDALSPTNFLATNPEVIRETMNSNGENLVNGLARLLKDVRKSTGTLKITTSDDNAFELGKDLAATKGKVIFKSEIMELIQYSPLTDEVYKTPLLIISPWINKYYVLDMRPENSFVKWLVEQGHTVFITSWVNPDDKLGHKTFEDYMFEGSLAALDAISKATGEKQVNVMGYCLGGTLTASTLAYLANKKRNDVKSVTYMTTLVDFSNPGDLGVFIDKEQIDDMENMLQETGFLHGNDMSHIFNMLRSNDLIWSFAVNNYLMGRNPFPFDLLYWNADSTGMPAKMHLYYMKNMYLNNLLAKKNALSFGGVPIDLTKINIPSYIFSAAEDHIVPWQSAYMATKIYNSPMRFILGGSGHVGGVINHPRRKKYGYKVASSLFETPEEWLRNTEEHEGSWWVDWNNWVKEYAGELVKARVLDDNLADAPGSYVNVRCV